MAYRDDYRCLSEMVTMLCEKNGIRLKPQSMWVWPDNAKALEDMAASLTEEQRAGLATGVYCDPEHQYSDEDAWVPGEDTMAETWDVTPLNKFLNAVFDGDLRKNFAYLNLRKG